jgi:hypothetical protein
MGQEKTEGSGGSDDQKKSGRTLGKLWVPIVLVIGTAIGAISYKLATEVSAFPHFPPGPPVGSDVYLEFHIILTTIGMALLVALIVVYARTYLQTKANFILGLLVFLFALLLQSILTYPVLIAFELPKGLAVEVFSPVADVFSIIAYTVFLYLSLE